MAKSRCAHPFVVRASLAVDYGSCAHPRDAVRRHGVQGGVAQRRRERRRQWIFERSLWRTRRRGKPLGTKETRNNVRNAQPRRSSARLRSVCLLRRTILVVFLNKKSIRLHLRRRYLQALRPRSVHRDKARSRTRNPGARPRPACTPPSLHPTKSSLPLPFPSTLHSLRYPPRPLGDPPPRCSQRRSNAFGRPALLERNRNRQAITFVGI